MRAHSLVLAAGDVRLRRRGSEPGPVFFLLAAMSSCAAVEPDPIRGEDRSVLAPRLRASLPIGATSDDGALSLDLELARSAGTFTQTLDGLDFIQLEDVRISAPAVVEAEFELSTFSVLLHRRLESAGGFFSGWAVGLGVTRLDLEVSAGALAESDVRTAVGPAVAGELGYELGEELAAFSRLTLNFGLSDSTYLSVLDLGAAWKPLPHLGLSAGWTFGSFELTEDSSTRSDIDIRSSGPFVTLCFGP